MTATLYEKFAFIGGAIYLQLYIWIVYPVIFETLSGLFGTRIPTLEGEELAGYRSLLTMVAPIGFIYIYAAWYKLTTLIDLTILWRLVWVAPWLYLSTQTSQPLQFEGAAVIASLDIGLPVMALLACPEEAKGSLQRLKDHFKTKPESDSQKVLMWLSRGGFVLAAGLAIMLFKAEDQHFLQSFSIAVSGCYHLLYDFFSRFHEPHAIAFSIFLQMAMVIGFLICVLVYGAAWTMAYDAQLAFSLIASFFYLYTLAWDKYVIKGKMSYFRWGATVTFLIFVQSIIWIMCSPLFLPNAQKIAVNQHRFDILLTTFGAFVCWFMQDLRDSPDETGWAQFHAKFVTWFTPCFLFWYCTEVKLIIMLNLGSPFHPSWLAKGLVESNVSFKYAMLQTTYGIAASLLVVPTAYMFYLSLKYFGSGSYTKGWRLLTWNGTIIIIASAYFMLVFGSGLPSFTQSLGVSFPPSIPRILELNSIDLVDTHVRDIVLGLMSMLAGVAADSTNLTENTKVVYYTVGLSWVLVVLPKIYLLFDVKMV